MRLSSLLENAYLILIFSILLLIGNANLVDNRLSHDFPYGYLASDAFQHQVRAEAIKDAGNFRFEAPYISFGFEKVVGRYPPVLYHLAVIFSYLTGLEVYDTIYFIVFFFASISALIMYLIIKNFNRNIALISLPLSVLIFAPGSIFGFTWGHWPSILSQFFLIAFFWGIFRIDIKASFIFIAAFASAMTLTHTSELFFGVLFLFIFFIIKFSIKDLRKYEIKSILIGGIISIIVAFYYLIIFKNTWMAAQPYNFHVMPRFEGNPALYIGDFGLLLILIIIGIVLSLFIIKKMHIAMIIGFAMLLMGFTNYVGFNFRAFQIRFFWPIYLSVFFGFGIYKLLKMVIKKWNILYSVILSVILIILLIGVVKIPYLHQYQKISTPGIMNPLHWEMLNWLSTNTEKDAHIYFFYGDIYGQDALLRNSKRTHSQVDPSDFVAALNSREIRREYVTEKPGDGGGLVSYRKTFFKFGDYLSEEDQSDYFGKKDICEFDYYILDKGSRQQALAQYNIIIANELLKNDFIQNVFENQITLILKNNKIGEDCIEERSF